MNPLQSFIHKENFDLKEQKNSILEQAKELLPPVQSYRCTLFQTMRQQFFFLPYYAYLFEIILAGLQLTLLNDSQYLSSKILFTVLTQLLFTYILARRSLLFEMEELEQVSRSGKKLLFFIRYLLIGFLMYGVLIVLIFSTLITKDIIFLKAAVLFSILYHMLSILIIYGTTQFSSHLSLTTMAIASTTLTLTAFILLQALAVMPFSILVGLSILTMILFYSYCYITMEKRCLLCN